MIFTVGHGARSAQALLALLEEACIRTLIDVRAYPASRRHPQFSRVLLEKSLLAAGIAYEWQGKALGGMRPSYIEHMRTEEFQAAVGALTAREERVCIMCAETDPASCHRSFIADWLASRGHRVVHLVKPGLRREHPARLL